MHSGQTSATEPCQRRRVVDAASVPRPIPSQGNGRRLRARLPQVLAAVTQIIEDGAESGVHTNSRYVAAFEERLRSLLGVEAVVGMASGSAVLRAALELLQLPAGSEVIVPGYTFAMTAYAVSDSFAADPERTGVTKGGLTPVFVDVDARTFTLDADRAREAITEKTKAIIPVHLTGQTADMRALIKLADEFDLRIVEDAAQAHGATSSDVESGKTHYAGSMGDLGAFSLSDVKNIGSIGGDAGALTITRRMRQHSTDASEAARAWRNTGRMTSHRYEHQTWGIRARMDEYSAAECLAQLDYLAAWTNRRRAIAARYTQALRSSPLQPPYIAPGRGHVFFNYMVKAPDTSVRNALIRRLHAAGIAVADTYTVVADQPLYHSRTLPCRIMALETSRELARQLVSIPCYPELTESEVDRIESVLASDE